MSAINIAQLTKSIGLVALLALLVGCGGGGGEQQEGGSKDKESTPPVTGSFVGATTGEEAFIVLVASGTEEEGEGERQVRAYLCDGEWINEWFNEGSVKGNELDLISEGGARLEGSLASEAATGAITLEDGEPFTFKADLASGAAGLFDANISEDGQIRGTSEAGGRLEGRVAHELGERGLYPVSGIITAPDGETLELVALSDEDEGGEYRWIVLPEGEVKGAKKSVATGSSSGFIDQATL